MPSAAAAAAGEAGHAGLTGDTKAAARRMALKSAVATPANVIWERAPGCLRLTSRPRAKGDDDGEYGGGPAGPGDIDHFNGAGENGGGVR